MRRNFTVCAILAAAMILVPLVSMKDTVRLQNKESSVMQPSDEYISVMNTKNGEVEKLEEREYLIGALAAEMDITFHDEALKAQVIACYTYSLYIRENETEDNPENADITNNPDKHQGYLSKEERQKKWGENFEKYEKKAGDIVDAVYGQAVYYEGRPILAVYHDLNNGSTQSALTVWKKDIPYLQEAESPGDKLSTDCTEIKELSYEEFKEKLSLIDGVNFSENQKEWLGKATTTENGYVKSIEICGNEVSSADFRTALNLESCCFEVKNSENKIIIEVTGRGHLVGMSQYGADYMSRQGADYREILTHYYQGTKIV